MRRNHLNHIFSVHLNINSLQNKLDRLVKQFTGNVDALLISETKLDDTFLEYQFRIMVFAPLSAEYRK